MVRHKQEAPSRPGNGVARRRTGGELMGRSRHHPSLTDAAKRGKPRAAAVAAKEPKRRRYRPGKNQRFCLINLAPFWKHSLMFCPQTNKTHTVVWKYRRTCVAGDSSVSGFDRVVDSEVALCSFGAGDPNVHEPCGLSMASIGRVGTPRSGRSPFGGTL